MSTTLLVGVILLALGGVVAGLRRSPATGLYVQATGSALVGIAGFWALVASDTAGSAFTSSFEPHVGLDPLSGVFLGMLGLVATPALVYSTAYLAPSTRSRTIAALCSAFVLSLVEVFCARDAVSFLLGWELMTLVPAGIILIGRSDVVARRTVFVYVAITHLGGAGVWIAMLLLANHDALGGGGIDPGSGLYAVVALAAVVGFGTKAGAVPFHSWLPRAHPIAPAPVSALMSGVMVKVGLYGLIRVLVEWLGAPPSWIGALVLGLGAISAVGGILYALFQRDLKKLLAFSTIDNVGIALLGIGACLLFRAHGQDSWAALALGAALLHAINHSVFKALLFLGAGSLERSTGSVDLDGLGGMLRRAPWTGWAILIGCGAIAGLPPLNGFASEWLTAQSLLRLPAYGGVRDGAFGAIALAALAATAALAVYCFVKVVGQALLGSPSSATVEHAKEVPLAMHAATTSLAAGCVVLGLVPGPLYERLVDLDPASTGIDRTAGVVVPGSGGLPTPALALAFVLFMTVFALARRTRTAEPAPTWACGQEIAPALTWTSAGFTKSLRLVLEPVLRPERQISVEIRRGVIQSASYTGQVPNLVDKYLYRPTTTTALALAAGARRLQTGRLGTYVAYLVAVVVTLLLAIKLGVLG
jgi:hydrogenase-4 component B